MARQADQHAKTGSGETARQALRTGVRAPVCLATGAGGQIAVMFALSMLAVIPLMGLIFDGGNMYVQRRTAQNAADAAALAGTRALMNAPVALGDTTVAAAVCTYLTANSFGVSPAATSSASFVGAAGGPLVPAAPIVLPTAPDPANPARTILSCALSSANNIPGLAAGVQVNAIIGPFPTFVAGFMGKGIAGGDGAGFAQATTAASSTVQGSAVTSFAADNSPFIVCGVNTRLALPGLQYFPILASGGPPYTIDPAAFGKTFIIHGNGIDTCGDTTSWKGLADQAQNQANNIGNLDLGTTPAILNDLPGAGANTTKNRVDGFAGCDSTMTDQCVMIIPIAISSPLPLTSNLKRCVAWGAFWITERASPPAHWGKLLNGFNVGVGPDSFTWTYGARGSTQIVSLGASK